MNAEQLAFDNRHGHSLSARISIPQDETPVGFVLLAHCFTCSKDLNAGRNLQGVLASSGLGVMSFDFTGLGHSGGEFSDTGFSTQAEDIVDAAKHLAHRYEPPAVLIGHSLGGTACLFASREIESVRGVATIGSPASPAHVEKLFTGKVPEIERTGEAEVSIGGRPFCIRDSFIQDVRENPLESWIGNMRAQLMILHSPVDTIVGIENAERLFKATRHPKSFVSLKNADHLLSRPEDSTYAGRILGAWARSIIELP